MIIDRNTQREEICLTVAWRKIFYRQTFTNLMCFSARTSIFAAKPPDQAQNEYSQHNQGLSMTIKQFHNWNLNLVFNITWIIIILQVSQFSRWCSWWCLWWWFGSWLDSTCHSRFISNSLVSFLITSSSIRSLPVMSSLLIFSILLYMSHNLNFHDAWLNWHTFLWWYQPSLLLNIAICNILLVQGRWHQFTTGHSNDDSW